jgi:hypothetical protein
MPLFIAVVPMNQSSVEKNGCSHAATFTRPVTARANRTAAVVTSEPFLANFTMSAPGTNDRKSSAAATSIVVGLLKFTPSAIARLTASTTGR